MQEPNTTDPEDEKIRNLIEFLESVTIENEDYRSALEKFREGIDYISRKTIDIRHGTKNIARMVDLGIIRALAGHLQSPVGEVSGKTSRILMSFAVEPHKKHFAESGALLHFVNNLATNSHIYSSIEVIFRLATNSNDMQNRIRMLGGIQALVNLLQNQSTVIQKNACRVLQVLSYNQENANMIIGCNAVSDIILMLFRDDKSIHEMVFDMIHTLDRVSRLIKTSLRFHIFPPLLRLFSSPDITSQIGAIELVHKILNDMPRWKMPLVQRGVLQLVINTLESGSELVQKSAMLLLSDFVQDTHNQVGIVRSGGLVQLLKMLDTESEHLQFLVAKALYQLARNQDNVSDFIKLGGVQKLQQGGDIGSTRECNMFGLILARLENMIQRGGVLRRLVYFMGEWDKPFQTRIALALAHLCSPSDSKNIFVDHYGLELLNDLLGSDKELEGVEALCKLVHKSLPQSSVDGSPSYVDDTPSFVEDAPNEMFRESFNDTDGTLSDVRFTVEGRQFLYAHKARIAASESVLHNMVLYAQCNENGIACIKLKQLRFDVLQSILRYIYTGTANVNAENRLDLLQAADWLDLAKLKQLCEHMISESLDMENVSEIFHLAQGIYNLRLVSECILFTLNNFQELRKRNSDFVDRIAEFITPFMITLLSEGKVG